MKYKYYYIISVLMVFIDQYSKNFINDNFILGESFVVNSFFSWTYIQNDGAAFGLLANSGDLERYFLLFVSVFASLFIIFWMHKTNINNRLILFAQSILLAGALGNFIDRMIYGKVTDFIDILTYFGSDLPENLDTKKYF